jgi:hypothetical protein
VIRGEVMAELAPLSAAPINETISFPRAGWAIIEPPQGWWISTTLR